MSRDYRSRNQSSHPSRDDGYNLRIAFDAKYLTDFFSVHVAWANDKRIVWKFADETAQSELVFEGEERLFSYVLLPLKS